MPRVRTRLRGINTSSITRFETLTPKVSGFLGREDRQRTLELEFVDPVGRVHMKDTLVAQQAAHNRLQCLSQTVHRKRSHALTHPGGSGPREQAWNITFRFPWMPVGVFVICFMNFTPSEKSCAGAGSALTVLLHTPYPDVRSVAWRR